MISPEEKRKRVTDRADVDLQFVLQQSDVDLDTQYAIVEHFPTLRRFSAMGDSRQDIRDTMQKDFAIDAAADLQSRATVASVICAWESSKEYVTKETELKTEARVLGLSRVLQQSERRAMLSAVETAYGRQQDAEMPSAEYLAAKMEEAESNEPQASALDEITSAKDSQASSIQSVVDSSGHLRITKLKSKGKAPCTTEQYRNLLKIEANAWLAVASRHKAKEWLHGITPAVFEQFVAYILGDRVNLLEIPSGANADGHSNPVRPPWHIVVAYEHKLRREAMKLVNKDGQPLCEAMKTVIKDADLKEAFFTTPVAMYLADSGPNKWPRYNSKGSDSGFHGAGKGFKGRGKGKKGKMSKAYHKGQSLVSHTPDGREICFAFNAQGCRGSCGRVNVCRVQGCYSPDHGAREHDKAVKSKPKE